MNRIEEQLLANLEEFTGFARSRVGDPGLAADVVQDSLLKALKSADTLRDDENVVAWFYRILRHSIIDLYRRRDVSQRGLARLANEQERAEEPEEQRIACRCVERLIPSLKPEYATLIRELDLLEQDPGTVAIRHGLSPNNLRVRHHRAKAQLRQRLEETCRICAKHGCLDCTCEPEKPE